MKSNFQDCLNRVLKDEGGYTNDPNDSGGPTNYGITIGDVRKYVKKNATAQDVRNLTLAQASDIYKSRYWDALGCDDLPSGVDYTCFDYGVNSGLGRPRKALQRFSNLSGVDLVNAINNERTAFLKAIAPGKNQKFLKGWLARVERVRAHSIELAQKTNVVAGPAAGTGIGGIGLAISQYFHNHEIAIIIGSLVAAFVIGAAIHVYTNRK